jgi:hypothetical protein
MGCAASCAASGRLLLLPGRRLAAWSPEDVAAWFATLPDDLQAYAKLADGFDGALLVSWNDKLLEDAGVANSMHRAQLLNKRDRAAATAKPAAVAPAASKAGVVKVDVEVFAKKGARALTSALVQLGPYLPWPGAFVGAAAGSALLPAALRAGGPAHPKAAAHSFPSPERPQATRRSSC